MTFKKFPEKIFINDIELLGWENAVEEWRVDTKQKLQEFIDYVGQLFTYRLYGDVVVEDNVPEYFKHDVSEVRKEIEKTLERLLESLK